MGTKENNTDTAINNVTAPFVSHAVSNGRKILKRLFTDLLKLITENVSAI
jgi:hypothetical protein